jgi:hypothetical protein
MKAIIIMAAIITIITTIHGELLRKAVLAMMTGQAAPTG